MREHGHYRGDILHKTFFPYPVMLQRAKYSRFRNDSLASTEEGTQSVSLNSKPCAETHAPGTSSLPVENVSPVSQDTSTTICTLIPKKYHFKLSSPTSLLGFKHFTLGMKDSSRAKPTESPASPSSTTSAEITSSSHLNSSTPSRQNADVDVKNSNNSLLLEIEKIPLDKRQNYSQNMSRSNMGTGLSYYVIYMGCIEVLQSMRSLDFGTRTQVTREAISRLCEAVPGAKGATKKRKPPLKFLSSVLGKSNLQFSGMNVTLTISTSSLILTNIDTKQVVANHHMQSISFASGGDPDTTDYIAYVAKDPVNQRACHILECSHSKAQEVISTIGHAFELRFKQFLKSPSFVDSSDSELLNFSNATHKVEEKEGHDYYNDIPGKVPPAGGVLDKRTLIERGVHEQTGDEEHSQMGFSRGTNIYENCIENLKIVGPSAQNGLHIFADKEQQFDDPSYINTVPKPDTSDKNHTLCVKQNISSDVQDILDSRKPCQGNKKSLYSSIQKEEWYHGKMNRKNAESLLINDGDFLVRESTTSASQYVLSGLHGGQHKHLLLVDPEGKVRTKDHVFENVNHLIKYHMENNLPIISSGSELCLRHPVTVQEVRMMKD